MPRGVRASAPSKGGGQTSARSIAPGRAIAPGRGVAPGRAIAPEGGGSAGGGSGLLALHAHGGNRAVGRLLRRQAAAAEAAAPSGVVVGSASDDFERSARETAQRVAVGGGSAAPTYRGEPAGRGGFDPGAGFADAMRGCDEGRPLPGDVRRRLEPRFGVSLGALRVHAGSRAAALTEAVGADAMTFKRDIFMGRGKYAPRGGAGLGLLAHEVEHAISQRGHLGRRGGVGVVQRAAGLISKASAVAAGGGSGFLGGFRGAWGTYVDTLDAFEKADENDTATKIRLLLALQKAGKEVEAAKYEERKKTLVRGIRGDIKLLYYQLAQHDRTYGMVSRIADGEHAENKKKLGLDIEWRGKHHLQSKAKEGKDKESGDGRAPTTADVLVERVQRAPLTVNFKPHRLAAYVDRPYMWQSWETYKDRGNDDSRGKQSDYGAGRLIIESKFGYDDVMTEEQRENRPIYAGVNLFNDPRGAAPAYGEFCFVLKETVKERATYTAGDSMDKVRLDSQSRGTRGHVTTIDKAEQLLRGNATVLDALWMDEMGIEEANYKKLSDLKAKAIKTDYLEAQIHGGVAIPRDIAHLYVDIPKDPEQRSKTEAQYAVYIEAFQKKFKEVPIKYAR